MSVFLVLQQPLNRVDTFMRMSVAEKNQFHYALSSPKSCIMPRMSDRLNLMGKAQSQKANVIRH